MPSDHEKTPAAGWIRLGAMIVVLLVVLVAAAPFLSSSFAPGDTREILTHRASLGSLAVKVTEQGTLESSRNIEIKCNVKGGSTVIWVVETGTMVSPGDILVELDTSTIEDNVTQRKIAYENSLANKIISESDVAVAKTSITEYIEGTYEEEKSTMQKEIFDAEEAVRNAQLKYESSERLAAKGMLRSLQLEGEKFSVESAQIDLKLKKRRLDALEKFTKEKMLQELYSALSAAEARLAADQSALELEMQRLEREKVQLENCTIRSTGEGLVIFPSAAAWKETPDIEEGATVREQQTLLMIPELNQMQVKVGIHESKVDRLRIGMPARVQLQGSMLQGEVSEIAEVTRPAGWWTGNLVKYDTIIKLESQSGLKPGMSAIVDVILAEYENVLTIPVASIVESVEGFLCWVKTDQGVKKHVIELGDTNDEFTIVTAGLKEGDEVVLNPLAYIDEAQMQAIRPNANKVDQGTQEPVAGKEEATSKADPVPAKSGKPEGLRKKSDGGLKRTVKNPSSTRTKLLAASDRIDTGVLEKKNVVSAEEIQPASTASDRTLQAAQP